jgi:hypothetical protein
MQLAVVEKVSGRLSRAALTPKALRDRLFRKSRPEARRFEILDGESYSKDLGVLWAAYKAGSFKIKEGLTQEEFVVQIEEIMKAYQHTWIMDDENRAFSSGRGPVALIGANTIGLIVEPRALFFKWSSARNILRSSIAYLNMIRHSSKTGIVLVRTEKTRMSLPDHLKRYDMLYYLGKSAENEYLYSVRGRGSD